MALVLGEQLPPLAVQHAQPPVQAAREHAVPVPRELQRGDRVVQLVRGHAPEAHVEHAHGPVHRPRVDAVPAHRQGRHAVAERNHRLDGVDPLRPAVPDLDRAVVAPRDQHGALRCEPRRVDGGVVPPELADGAARRHVPQEHLLVPPAGRQLGVVTRHVHIAHLVAVPRVRLHRDAPVGVPKPERAVLAARQAVGPVRVEAHGQHGPVMALQGRARHARQTGGPTTAPHS
mmetsp:Transcript_9314/g.30654  ORF Transcript_9314/g.30654 Transcript_9314/m.30654 type:complete len:231 (-) Transcript_9314:67-759(-)